MALPISTSPDDNALLSALFGAGSGISIVEGSFARQGSPLAFGVVTTGINLGDSGLGGTRIAPGIVLSTGSLVDLPASNTDSGYTAAFDLALPGDDDLLAAAQSGLGNGAFETLDAASLSFEFTLSDPTKRFVSFDVVFASDEYPEFANSFVDIGAIFVDGINRALFNRDASRPLSVLQANIDAGYFLNNSGDFFSAPPDETSDTPPATPYAIEFDGVSYRLRVFAELPETGSGQNGAHRLKIGIADTNDEVLDSAIFVSNFRVADTFSDIATEFAPDLIGNAKVKSFIATPSKSASFFSTPDVQEDALAKLANLLGIEPDELLSIKNVLNQSNYFEGSGVAKTSVALYGGDDLLTLGDGPDIAFGGTGNDRIFGRSGNDKLFGEEGDDLISAGLGKDLMVGGSGADTFRFDSPASSANADKVTDFITGLDAIELDSAVFQRLEPGSLQAENFFRGKSAADADDYVILSGTKLLYDADGNGPGKAMLIATITGSVPTLPDFAVV